MPRLSPSGRTAPAPKPRAAPKPKPAAPRTVAGPPAPKVRQTRSPQVRAVARAQRASVKQFRPVQTAAQRSAAARGAKVSAKRTGSTARQGDFVASGKLNTRQVSDTREKTARVTRNYKVLRARLGTAHPEPRAERPAPFDAEMTSAGLRAEGSGDRAGAQGRQRPKKPSKAVRKGRATAKRKK